MFDFSRLHLEDPIDKKKAEEQIDAALEFDKVTMDENEKQSIYSAIFVEKCVTNESLFFNSKCEALQKHLNSLGYFILEGKLDALENERLEIAASASSEPPISKETQIDYEEHITEAKSVLSKLTKYYEKNKAVLGTKTIDFVKFRATISKAEAALQDPSRTTASLEVMLNDLKVNVATLESEQTECELLVATKEKGTTEASKTKAEAEVASATNALAEATKAVETLTTSSPELDGANAELKVAEEALEKATAAEAKVKPDKPKAKAKAQAAVDSAKKAVLAAREKVARLTSLLGAKLEEANRRVKEAQGNLAKATDILAKANELHAAAEEKVKTSTTLHDAATAKKNAATEAAEKRKADDAVAAAEEAAKAAEAKAIAEAAEAAKKPKVYDDYSVIQNLTSDNLMVLKLWAFLTRADEKVIEYGATEFPAISKEVRANVSKFTRIIPGRSPEKIIAEKKADIAEAVLAILADSTIAVNYALIIEKAENVWAAYCEKKRGEYDKAEESAKLEVDKMEGMPTNSRTGNYASALQLKKSTYIRTIVYNSNLKLIYTGTANDWITIAGPANANTIGTLRTAIAKGMQAQIQILQDALKIILVSPLTTTDPTTVTAYKRNVAVQIKLLLTGAITRANEEANTYLVTIRIPKRDFTSFLTANGIGPVILSITWTTPGINTSVTITKSDNSTLVLKDGAIINYGISRRRSGTLKISSDLYNPRLNLSRPVLQIINNGSTNTLEIKYYNTITLAPTPTSSSP